MTRNEYFKQLESYHKRIEPPPRQTGKGEKVVRIEGWNTGGVIITHFSWNIKPAKLMPKKVKPAAPIPTRATDKRPLPPRTTNGKLRLTLGLHFN